MVSVSLKGIKRAEPSFAAASEGDEPAGGRLSPYGLSSLLPPLRCGVASPQVCYGISYTMCINPTNVTRVAPAGMWSAVALWALEPPASASLRRGKPAGMLRYFHFDSIPMQTMCRKSTSVAEQTLNFLECKQILAFSSCAQLFSPNFCPAFSFLRNRKKKKRT